MPNVLVLTFTRPLTEFVKTGCIDDQGREIFPQNCVSTIEAWLRSLYKSHETELPESTGDFIERKRTLARGAIPFANANRMPLYDALFVDEAQDLLQEEVDVIAAWSKNRFFVGDDRQKIHAEAEGLNPVRKILPVGNMHALKFHYRLAPEICRVADRILVPHGGDTLESTCHYIGPTPASVSVQPSSQTSAKQLDTAKERLKQQVRVYADLLAQGDRIGVIVARKDHREVVLKYLSQDPNLKDLVQIVRARNAEESDFDPAFDSERPICILTVKGCKGLEFRTVHWLFADELSHHHRDEDYYTVITRAKTSIDIYYTKSLPAVLARAHAADGVLPW
jgi:DNA helicase IV